MGINVSKEDMDDDVDGLVEMIDRLIEGGDGHLTIDVDEMMEGIKVKTYRSNDCGVNGACAQPNEKAIDED